MRGGHVRLAVLTALLALPLGCGGDPPTAPVVAPSGPVDVTTSFYPTGIYPGQETILSVSVNAPDGQTVTSTNVVFSGLLNDTVPLPTPKTGSFGYTIKITTTTGPIEGPINAVVVARLGSTADTARANVNIIDDGPPHFDNLFFHVYPSPGDTMNVAFVAKDVAGIAQMTYHIHGALDLSDGNTYNLPSEIAVQVRRFVPRSVRLGDSVIVDVSVWDGFGKKTTSTIRTITADYAAPSLTATLNPGPYDSLLPWRRPVRFAGDTMLAAYQVRDNIRITWVGWQIPDLGLGDSVAVGDTAYAGTLRVPVTTAMDGPGRYITMFARDSSQNRAVTSVYLDFVDATRRSFQVAGPGYAGEPLDAVVGLQRGVVLILGGGLKVVTTTPFASLGSVFGLPSSYGADIAPGGDTAWVADGNGSMLKILRLDRTPMAIVDSMAMQVPYGGQGLRVTPDRRALISGTLGGINDPGIVTVVNLVTGVSSNHSVTGFPGRITASQDRSLFIGFDGSGRAMTYVPATNQFGPPRSVSAGRPSVDAHGTLVLIRNALYDGGLNFLRVLGPPAFAGANSLISSDGQYAYFGIWPGYQKVRISDGAVVEKVFMPSADFMVEIPGQDRLLMFGQPVLTLVDLSPGGVIPAARN